MATKLKKTRPFAALFFFVAAISALIVSALFAVDMASSDWEYIGADYKDTKNYEQSMSELIRAACVIAQAIQSENSGERYFSQDEQSLAWQNLQKQGVNISYYIQYGGKAYSANTVADSRERFKLETQREFEANAQETRSHGFRSSYAGFEYVLTLEGGNLTESMNTRNGSSSQSKMMLMQSKYALRLSDIPYQRFLAAAQDDGELFIGIAVRADGRLMNYGSIYESYYFWYITCLQLLILVSAAALSLIILFVLLFKRRSLEQAGNKLSRFFGWFWMEVKLAAILFGIMAAADGVIEQYNYGFNVAYIVLTLAGFWTCYFLLSDLGREGKAFFSNNIVMSLIRFMKTLESSHKFVARMKKRLVIFISAELVLAVIAAFIVITGYGAGVLLALIPFIVGLILAAHYIDTYNREMNAFGSIIDYVNEIRSGSVQKALEIDEKSEFHKLAEALNDVHGGMVRMVEERVKSEKMKAELVTNVSHDLKTPLTSIINYADLLGRESLTPEFANDYVKILSSKAQRLKNLVQDLFEISKANSGAVDLDMQQINLAALLEQTVAEQDGHGKRAGVETRLSFLDNPLIVRADGRKLHRVFENLLGNALKYAMIGTRVYVTAEAAGANARITFKNISSYEMNFTPADIMERFTRGDSSRTTDGSGLGLAIAKSFLELNGGELHIELDGDLFRAIVTIPLYVPYSERTREPEQPEQQEQQEYSDEAERAYLEANDGEAPFEAAQPVMALNRQDEALQSAEQQSDANQQIQGVINVSFEQQQLGADATPPRWGIPPETFEGHAQVSPEAERFWKAMELEPDIAGGPSEPAFELPEPSGTHDDAPPAPDGAAAAENPAQESQAAESPGQTIKNQSV